MSQDHRQQPFSLGDDPHRRESTNRPPSRGGGYFPYASPARRVTPAHGQAERLNPYLKNQPLRTPPGLAPPPIAERHLPTPVTPSPRELAETQIAELVAPLVQPLTEPITPGTEPVIMRPVYEPPPKKRRGGLGRALLFLLICVIIGGGTAAFVSQMMIRDWEAAIPPMIMAPPATPEPPPPSPEPPPTPVTPTRTGNVLTAEEVYELGRSQVVGIRTEISNTNVFGEVSTNVVTGTGFIVSSDGYILTNYHVIENATRILVVLEDGTVFEAQLVGGESVTSDMAVLKIEATDLTPATIGNSSSMRVGASIFAIGNPLGSLTHTITQGIVSALNRDITIGPGQTINMFQIDAAVNSGNSGGPVYNDLGEVVGIVTAKASVDGVEGIGFAIPIDEAMNYADQIIERGYVARPWLGIVPVTVSESYAESFGSVAGVFINTVYDDSPAAIGGIRAGDIITHFGGVRITSVEELRAVLNTLAPGDVVPVIVFRDGENLEIGLTLIDRPPDDYVVQHHPPSLPEEEPEGYDPAEYPEP